MGVFDVHVNRTPISGTIRQVVYISGKFLNADLDKASDENERQHFVVEAHDGRRVGFTQIAGLVARRIVTFAKTGDIVAAGQRIGRSEEHTSELQSLMRISYAVFCLNKKNHSNTQHKSNEHTTTPTR